MPVSMMPCFASVMALSAGLCLLSLILWRMADHDRERRKIKMFFMVMLSVLLVEALFLIVVWVASIYLP